MKTNQSLSAAIVLGLIAFADPALAQIPANGIETFTQDWESSRRYYAPDPLAPQEHDETDFPYDPELIHE